MKKLKYLITSVIVFSPYLVFAQSYLTGTDTFFKRALSIISSVAIPLVFSLALLYFFWGMAKYILAAGGGDKAEGKQIMIWGVVALFVMSAVWGLVEFIRTEFGINKVNNINIPTINGGGAGADLNL